MIKRPLSQGGSLPIPKDRPMSHRRPPPHWPSHHTSLGWHPMMDNVFPAIYRVGLISGLSIQDKVVGAAHRLQALHTTRPLRPHRSLRAGHTHLAAALTPQVTTNTMTSMLEKRFQEKATLHGLTSRRKPARSARDCLWPALHVDARRSVAQARSRHASTACDRASHVSTR